MINPEIEIGPLTFHIYGLIIGISILCGWYIAKKRAHIYKINQKEFEDPILLVPLVLSILGARIYHIADYWQVYSKDLLSIFKVSSGGLGIWGALIGTFIGFMIVSKVKKIKLLTILDMISPPMILSQAIGRIGNFVNQEGFGAPTGLPWGVFIEERFRPQEFKNYSFFHPTFFYEAILDMVVFALLVAISKKSKKRGQTFGSYLILYGLSRFIIEFFRIDTWTVGEMKIAHLLSIIAVAYGIFLIYSTRRLDSH